MAIGICKSIALIQTSGMLYLICQYIHTGVMGRRISRKLKYIIIRNINYSLTRFGTTYNFETRPRKLVVLGSQLAGYLPYDMMTLNSYLNTCMFSNKLCLSGCHNLGCLFRLCLGCQLSPLCICELLSSFKSII